MPDRIISIRLEISNKNIKEEFKQVISSLNGYRIYNSDNPGYSDLLIQEIGDNIEKEFQFVHSLKESGMVKEFFLTSTHTEHEIIIQALRAGAKELFTQTINREEIKAALLKVEKHINNVNINHNNLRRGKIINAFGSKGGVGTTTVAVNLAASLNELEDVKSVALMDMNLLFGEIPLFLDVNTVLNWGEMVKNISRVDTTYLKSALTKHSTGVHVLPSPSGLDGVNLATPDIIEHLLGLMRNEYDFIVIDNGQSIDDISLKILELSDMVLLVSILSLPSLVNIKRLLETCSDLGHRQENKVKVIINRYHKKSEISVKEAEEATGKKISWFIPNDYHTTMSAINQGKVLSSVTKKAKIVKNFRNLAFTFLESNENKKERSGFWRRKSRGK